MGEHKPGPWYTDADCGHEMVVDAKGQLVADCCVFAKHASTESNIANARLVAAAPANDLVLKLLEHGLARIERSGQLVEFCFDGFRYSIDDALIRYSSWLDHIGWDRVRRAIAKAEGRAP